MYRLSTYVTIAIVGLACYACESPMEVAAEASAHTPDAASSPEAPNSEEEAESESTTETRSSNPARTDMYPLPPERSLAQGNAPNSDDSEEEALSGELNLNDASREKLELLPGIGPAIAERIDSYRTRRRFEEIDDIKRVKGIGDATFADLKPYLAVSGETTLSE